jgi:alpha-L-fucosidase
VGPDSFGNIPSMQQKPLKELGAWLKVNGNAIYATRPWERFGYDLPSGGRLRFTQDDNNLYAIIVGDHSREIVLEDLGFEPKIVKLLGQGNVPFSQKDKNWVIQVGPYLEGDSAKILQISKI